MSLMARVSLAGPPGNEPEDLLGSALSVIFPDDATNQHGDADHGVLYTSPRLPAPLHLSLTDPSAEGDRKLFSHFLWNASLLLAELVEAASSSGSGGSSGGNSDDDDLTTAFLPPGQTVADAFSVAGLATIELGAGTALPSLLAALLGGAVRVAITDYPSEVVLSNLRANVARNVRQAGAAGAAAGADNAASGDGGAGSEGNDKEGSRTNPPTTAEVTVDGHEWGAFDTDVARTGHHAFDRVFVCDCLWMPWQHDNLRRSIDWFLKEEEEEEGGDGAPKRPGSESESEPPASVPPASPRCWVVAGFHTGRAKVAAFFDEAALAQANLEIEAIWERDCNHQERPWAEDRGIEDPSERKRWLCVAILRRRRRRRRGQA